MYEAVEKAAERLAKTLALLGGLVLLIVVILACLSIAGRTLQPLGLNQINGDFELVELGTGFAIFSFLAWTQFTRAHARVDMFEPFFGSRLNRLLDLAADLLVCAIALLIAWRLGLGMLDKHGYQETTFILLLPIWWAYLAGLCGAIAFALVSLFCLWRSARRLVKRS